MSKLFLFIKQSSIYFFIPIIISLATVFLLIFIFLLFLNILPPRLPLFYTLPWGEYQLVSKEQFLILPTILFLASFTNIAISWQLHDSQIFLKRALLLSIVPLSLIIIITSFKIITVFL